MHKFHPTHKCSKISAAPSSALCLQKKKIFFQISSTTESSLTEQNNGDLVSFDCVSAVLHGQCLSYDDRESVTKMMECMVHNALLPWVERQMRTLNEQVIARRGISKSLTTGVRKWFGAAAAQQATSITYENLLPYDYSFLSFDYGFYIPLV